MVAVYELGIAVAVPPGVLPPVGEGYVCSLAPRQKSLNPLTNLFPVDVVIGEKFNKVLHGIDTLALPIGAQFRNE